MNPGYGNAGYGGPSAAPPGKVNFGWIGEAWGLFSANMGVWILSVLLIFLVPIIVGALVGAFVGATGGLHPYTPTPGASPYAGRTFSPFETGSWATMLSGGLPLDVSLGLRLFSLLWTTFFLGGVSRMAVMQVRGQTANFADLFSGGPLFLSMLGFYLVAQILGGVGLLLCILPAFIVAGLLLPGYALIADGASLGDAFSRSIDGMKQDWLSAAGFALVLGLLVLVSAIPCGLGLLVTMPMTWLISALAYRDMVGMPNPPGAAVGGVPPAPGVWPPPPSV